MATAGPETSTLDTPQEVNLLQNEDPDYYYFRFLENLQIATQPRGTLWPTEAPMNFACYIDRGSESAPVLTCPPKTIPVIIS